VSVIFGKWMNALPTVAAVGALGGLCTVVAGFWYYATPKFWEIGYMPAQPSLSEAEFRQIRTDKKQVPGVDFPGFSHQLHAGKLGMDCRYCHTKIEVSAEANIPNVATCYGCHAENHVQLPDAQNARTEFVRTAHAADASIHWRRVHKLPDYVRNFPHNVHVNAGVSCYSCHGQIDGMPVVSQRESISMGWCLDCHRKTAKGKGEGVLVPREKVTDLVWVAEYQARVNSKQNPAIPNFSAKAIFDNLRMMPPENCGACHY
jgi:hypothetical protein